MISLAGVFTVVFWGIVAALIVILTSIARFYEVTSGQVSHYRWFALPLALLVGGAVRYALLGGFAGDALGDLLTVLGSIALIVLGVGLLRLMTGGRR